MPPSRWLIGLVIGVLVLGAVWTAVHRDPWDPDETRYLQVARELADRGSPMLLTYNQQPYTDKPPLFFWLLAPLALTLGFDSAVPGMVISLASLLGLLWATRRLGLSAGLAPEIATWGSLLTITALLPVLLAAICRMDVLFALLTTLAFDRLVRLAGPEPPGWQDHLMLWLWIGLGVLTKGPLALALTLGPLLVLAPTSLTILRRAILGWGPLLAMAMVVAWLAPAAVAGGPQWLEAVVVHQTAGRLHDSFAHAEPWWYHLAAMPASMLPWFPVALAGLGTALTRLRQMPLEQRLVVVHPLTTLLLLSVVSGKTVLYPLPMFATAGLVGAWWFFAQARPASRRVAVAVAGLLVLGAAGVLGKAVASNWELDLEAPSAILVGASLGLPGVLAAALGAFGRMRAAIGALSLSAPLLLAAGIPFALDHWNRLLSLRPLAVALNAAEPDDARPALAFVRLQPGYLLFSGRQFRVLTEVVELADSLDQGRVVVIGAKVAGRLAQSTDLQLRAVAEIRYRHSPILLISSAAAGPAVATAESLRTLQNQGRCPEESHPPDEAGDRSAPTAGGASPSPP